MTNPVTEDSIIQWETDLNKGDLIFPTGSKIHTENNNMIVSAIFATLEQRTKERDELKEEIDQLKKKNAQLRVSHNHVWTAVDDNEELIKERDELKRKIDKIEFFLKEAERNDVLQVEIRRLKEEVEELKGMAKDHVDTHHCFGPGDNEDLPYEFMRIENRRLKEENARLLDKDMAWLNSDVTLRNEIAKLQEQINLNTPHEALIQLQEEKKALQKEMEEKYKGLDDYCGELQEKIDNWENWLNAKP